jgi:putative transposase
MRLLWLLKIENILNNDSFIIPIEGSSTAIPCALHLLKTTISLMSMTEQYDSCENAVTERVNGILKDEFYLDQTFDNVAHAKRAAKNAINLYNEIRLHLSLDYKTPNMVYKLSA